MIRVNGKHEIPSRWEELTPEHFVNVVTALLEYQLGQLDFQQFRTTLVCLLIDAKVEDPSNPILCENIYRLAEVLTFPYRYIYADPRFSKLSPALQEKLGKVLPSSLDDSDPEVRIAAQFKAAVEPDLCFGKQLLPRLPVKGTEGYRFSYAGQMADTNLTARQYIEANSLISLIHEKSEDTDMVLEALIGVLYCPRPYDPDTNGTVKFSDIPFAVKMAVMYNYIAIAEWISRLPKYDLIFHRADGRRSSSPLGQEGSLLSIAEKGYGDYPTVCRMNVFTFLDILLKQTVDTISEMKAYKVKNAEIASKLNLSIEQINTIAL